MKSGDAITVVRDDEGRPARVHRLDGRILWYNLILPRSDENNPHAVMIVDEGWMWAFDWIYGDDLAVLLAQHALRRQE